VNAARWRSSGPSRHAVTLVEVLLVLALLVVLASIAWPALQRPLSGQRLRKSADAVRVVWARSRVKAMSTGQTLVFRYSVEGDRYSLQYHAGPEFSSDTLSEESETFPSGADPSAFVFGHEAKLPEGVVFMLGETAEDTRATSLVLEEAPMAEAGTAWSEPILFYPDGTSSTVRLVLRNEFDRAIELSLRGLTGVVTMGEPYSAEGQSP
jgi:prepilin-type N-terminal cleavage/methylation domain-containing protein